jgi:hypothetical protein
MKTKKVLFYLLAGILGGCVPVLSLHPLYDDKHTVFEEKLLGTFTESTADSNFIWEFTHADKPNIYRLIYSSLSRGEPNAMKGLFEAHLVKLDGHFFMDIYPKEVPWGNGNGDEDLKRVQWPWNAFFILPVHTFIKVETLEPQLEIWLTDDDGLKKLLQAEPNAIKHESEQDSIVLTASTKELQTFVLKYAEGQTLFSNKHTLTRKTAESVQDANQPKNSEPNTNDIPADSNGLPV